MTLIDKLEHLEKEFLNKERNNINGVMKLIASATASGINKSINIVKQHQAESGWISVDEQLPYAEEMLTNHYNPKEFYEIILKTGELLITSFTHLKNDGNNEIVFMDCTITLIDGEWKLLDDGRDVYEVDEVSYWKPIQPPNFN